MKLLDLPLEMFTHMMTFLLSTHPIRSRLEENVINLGTMQLISSQLSKNPNFVMELEQYWEIILLGHVQVVLDKKGKIDDEATGIEFSTVGFEQVLEKIREKSCKRCFAILNEYEKRKNKSETVDQNCYHFLRGHS